MGPIETLKAVEEQKRARKPFADPLDQAEHTQESMRLFADHIRGGPQDRVQYEARRRAVRDRLKKLHENRMAADGQ